MSVQIIHGDCRSMLPTFPAESVQSCVTSPPYFGLRDYGVDGQIGLEPSPQEYVDQLVAVFREVRRVLRTDGTLWLNLGDSYNSGSQSNGHRNKDGTKSGRLHNGTPYSERTGEWPGHRPLAHGLAAKQLFMIPARVALALQADGWWLRSDIIWHKPNPMPESIQDRPTSAHEHVFLLAKGQWRQRSVKLADLGSEKHHLLDNAGSDTPDAWAHRLGVGLAASILDCPEIKQELSGLTLQSQIGEQRTGASSCDSGVSLPSIHSIARKAASFLHGDASAKEFLGEFHRLRPVLRKRNHLLVSGGSLQVTLAPPLNSYGETSVTIHDAGKIGEFDLVHGEVIAHAPTTCTYFYDAKAIAEPFTGHPTGAGGTFGAKEPLIHNPDRGDGGRTVGNGNAESRNARNVWTIATCPYREAHFATFPPELAERCIKAGSRPGDTVLDPFAGAGTTLLVADRLQRHGIGIELNPEYAAMAERRVHDDAPLLTELAACA